VKVAAAVTGTLRATLDPYLTARKDLSERSRTGYRYQVERHLAGWLDRPLRDVTAGVVEELHTRIKGAVEGRGRTYQATGNATANNVLRTPAPAVELRRGARPDPGAQPRLAAEAPVRCFLQRSLLPRSFAPHAVARPIRENRQKFSRERRLKKT
jgi:hypothetical protein